MSTVIPKFWTIEPWKKEIIQRGCRTSRFWKTVLSSDPALESIRTCVEIVFGGGERLLISTHNVTSFKKDTSIDGARGTMSEMAYKPLLMESIPVSANIQIGKGSSSARSFSLNVAQVNLDVIKMLKSGRALAGYGEVSLQVDGMNWEDRAVIIRGEMVGGVRFGSKDQMIDLEIVDPKNTNDIFIPPTQLNQIQYPDMPDSYNGFRIPMIINRVTGIPCVRVSDVPTGTSDMAWIAFQSPFDQHVAGSVYVDGEIPGPGQYPSSSSISQTDNIRHTNIDFSMGAGAWEDSTSVYCDADLKAGAKQYGLIEVIKTLVRDWSNLGISQLNADLFSWAETRCPKALIPSVLINANGSSSSATAQKYIENVLCKSYPMISMAFQDGGYGPVYYDRRISPVMSLTVNQYPLLKRQTAITETPKDKVFNKFTYKYGYDTIENTFKSFIERSFSNSDYCLASTQQFGVREHDIIESKVVVDESSTAIVGLPNGQANFVIDWLVDHKSLPSYYAEYDAYSAIYFKLRLGDNVTLYDFELSEDPISATVEKITIMGGKAVVGFRMWILYDYIGKNGLGAIT